MSRSLVAATVAMVVVTAVSNSQAHAPSPRVSSAYAWPMFQGDMQHTGRAAYAVPASRMDGTFFDVFSWQTPSPGSPADGGLGASSMPFFGGAGPGGTDLVVGTYHWPKGVIGMDRVTGHTFWLGLPDGGEQIGDITPAFSSSGVSIYVTNDATPHPLMAFAASTGPSGYRHNGADPSPGQLSLRSPTLAPDGRIFLYQYGDRAYGGTDNGSAIQRTWTAANATSPIHCNPSLYQNGAVLQAVIGGDAQALRAYNGATGAQLWSVPTPGPIAATPSIDPANGRVYTAVGYSAVYVLGVDRNGAALWGSPTLLVHDDAGGTVPERAIGAGAISADGSTYYFQTSNDAGTGALYAINTNNGAVRWRLPTHSRSSDEECSSPIVTTNGVIVVGNNQGGVYYAVHDLGASAQPFDSLVVGAGGLARASATISGDGFLYLPVRTTWTVGNGDSPVASGRVENLYCSIDLRAGAMVVLPPPSGQIAVARNGGVELSWRRVTDLSGHFHHYAVYRSTAPFDSVTGLAPVAQLSSIDDTVAVVPGTNGAHYWLAATTVSTESNEVRTVRGRGPRTPRNETDLQVVAIARTPRFPRYLPLYTGGSRTEPSGFGPYNATAATGLDPSQSETTRRWPSIGEMVTYTATVRNRGTNSWPGALAARWRVDGTSVATPSQSGPLAPGSEASFAYVRAWDGLSHLIEFSLAGPDARASNDTLSVDTRSVAYLSYVDMSYIEDFREVDTPAHTGAKTDDFIDWVNLHMKRFNLMFANAGTPKRVHYDVLRVVRDDAPDPADNRTPFAIFPLRFHSGEASYRVGSAYYDAGEDIDFGYLHEMGHQLGLIDLYRMDVDLPSRNQVSGLTYFTTPCLMNQVSHLLSPHSALAMTHWEDQAHGYFGQYLYGIPRVCRLRFTTTGGQPLRGATVTVYQYCDRPGLGSVITNQAKSQGFTDSDGLYILPNVPIDPVDFPPLPIGDTLRANPFGFVDNAGTNGVLHLRVSLVHQTQYAWFDLPEANVAFYTGQRDTATFEKPLPISLAGVEPLDPPRVRLTFANPFQARGHFDVSVSQAGAIVIAIYDLGGRRVRTLTARAPAGGDMTLDWDGRDDRGQPVPVGMYLVHGRVDRLETRGKLTLLR